MQRGILSIYDDAFITFRYAENLARGVGPVYNPGESVEGYTNFLWMLILAIARMIGFSIEWTSIFLGVLSAIGLLAATYYLMQRIYPGRWLPYIPVLILAGTPSIARYAISGMETLLFCALITVGFGLVLSPSASWRIDILASLVFVLSSLTRPEGLLFAFFGLGYRLTAVSSRRGSRARPWRVDSFVPLILPWLLIFLPYLTWRMSFYGYPLPNTFYAKVGPGGASAIGRGFTYLLIMLALVNPQILLPLVALPWMKMTKSRRLILLLASVYLLYLVYIGGDDYRIFGPRLILPIFPSLSVLGIAALTDLIEGLRMRRRRMARFTLSILFSLLLIFYAQVERTSYIALMETMSRGWHAAADWIDRTASRGAVIAVDAAGIIPFYTGLEAIDMHGLNDEHIAHLSVENMGAGLAGHEKTDPEYVIARQPDYVAVWIDEWGRPSAAGLGPIAHQFLKEYSLQAIVLMSSQDSGGQRVRPGEELNPEAYAQGYYYGIFGRRIR